MPVTNGAPKKKKEIKRPGRRVPRIQIPRTNAPPLTVRGPRAFIKKTQATDEPPPPPGNITITLPEWHVFWWLVEERKMIPGEDFVFQSSLEGGRNVLGGLVTDFWFPKIVISQYTKGLVINVDGEAWHRYYSADRANDLTNDLRLMDLGYWPVHVLEDDVLTTRRNRVLSRALVGEQLHPRT